MKGSEPLLSSLFAHSVLCVCPATTNENWGVDGEAFISALFAEWMETRSFATGTTNAPVASRTALTMATSTRTAKR